MIAPPQPTLADADALRDLFTRGRALDAHAYASRFAPLEAWTNPRARRAAGWLCESLGAPKRARALELGTYRRSPRAAAGRSARLHMILLTRGPLEGWRALRAERDCDDTTKADRAELRLLESHVLTRFRDFDRAAAAVLLAEELGASPRRVALYEAQIFVARDLHREALDAAFRARSVAPDSPDVLGLIAHLHVLLGDGDEALAVLRAGAARTQSAEVALQLVGALDERGLYDERHEWIERWSERVPLLERPETLSNLRADSAFQRGDLRTALELQRRDTSKVSVRLADRLATTMHDPTAKRVLLQVPFVRQHHMTCAPATLSALASYWSLPADHLEVADAICYDGTPAHSQRTWAEEHGFVAREMTVTWEVARALLDRGVPFTVAIVEGASAHLQAIVGYDERRGTLILRDPFLPNRLEALAEEWLETWRSTGPLGMVLVPKGEEGRIDGIDLPDAPLCDRLHALQAALGRHDRDTARKACDELAALAPGHRLALAARRALAAYDQDLEGVLACAREAATRFPDFAAARLDALQCMRAVRGREERIAEAEALLRAYPKEPLYAEALALTLADDARQHPAAARLLRRAHRARPDRHGPLALVADIAWDARSLDDALTVRRFAACLGRFDEAAAFAYFASARALGREGEALALLEARVTELGARAAAPIGTLYRALETLGRADDGLRVVEACLARRPDDPELLLLAADIRGGIGDIGEARALLARAEPGAKRTQWLRGAAHLALRAGAFGERTALLEQLLEREPLDVMSHVSYASALAASEGASAARASLERAWAARPHLRTLAHVYLEWLRGSGAVATERAARKVLEIDPADDWTHRELALALVQQGRVGEAWKALEVAAAVAPTDASLHCSRAIVFRHEGKRDEAQAALLAALELDPDRDTAIVDLLAAAKGNADRERTLHAVENIVHPRSVSGAGILAWYGVARTVIEPDDVAARLERLRAGRPKHPVAWTTSVEQRSLVGDHDAALRLSDEACARFPLVAAVWTARADALLSARKNAEALAAIEHAARIDSLSAGAASRLANAHVRSGDATRGRDVLVRAVGRLPTSTGLRVQLAELAWGMGDRAKALAEIEAVLALDADHEHAWNLLDAWSKSGAQASDALARIQSLSADRPWSAHAALNLARARIRHDDAKGALAALDRATTLEPRLIAAHDLRVVLLAHLGRFDEAEAACAPECLAGAAPRELSGRAAWVRARRGDLEGACRTMREILEEHIEYAWGWSELAKWEQQRGAPAALLDAARHLVAVSPTAGGNHRVLAAALLETGDRASARKELERAVDLAPNDEDTLVDLFDAVLDEGDQRAAEELIPLLRASRPASALSAEARLFALRGEGDHAIAALRALVVESDVAADAIDDAYRACIFAGLAEHCESVTVDALDGSAGHPRVGEIWVRRRLEQDDLAGVLDAMKRLDAKNPAVRGAAGTWLELLRARGARDAAREAARLVRKRFAPCDDGLWAAIAASLLAGACDECVSWTRDWRARTKATSWMLLNVASALRELGEHEEAYEVVQHAAQLPTDLASRSHRSWLAFELAMRGEHVEARRWLTAAGDVTHVPVLESVAALTEAALVAPEAGRSASSFARARGLLASGRPPSSPGVVQLAHARAVARVAGDAGLIGTIWRYRSSLGAVAAVAAVVLVAVAFTGTGGSGSGTSGLPSFPPLLIFALVFGVRAAMSRRGGRA